MGCRRLFRIRIRFQTDPTRRPASQLSRQAARSAVLPERSERTRLQVASVEPSVRCVMGRLSDRRQLQEIINQQSRDLDQSAAARGLDAYYERALAMLNSEKVRDAFDLSREPDMIREAYGRTTYGQSCLLARRLVQSGVKFVPSTLHQASAVAARPKAAGILTALTIHACTKSCRSFTSRSQTALCRR